jgi:hypothetical protein
VAGADATGRPLIRFGLSISQLPVVGIVLDDLQAPPAPLDAVALGQSVCDLLPRRSPSARH